MVQHKRYPIFGHSGTLKPPIRAGRQPDKGSAKIAGMAGNKIDIINEQRTVRRDLGYVLHDFAQTGAKIVVQT